MTLFIQNDTAVGGTGAVFPNIAEADLLQISNLDMAGLGETTQPPPSHLIEVTYGTQTEHGPCPDRLHELVNTQFGPDPAHPVNITIVAVDNSFLLGGSIPIGEVIGISIPPTDPLNPTGGVLVVYDTSSGGLCEKAEGSDVFDLDSPSPVTLYHELSHARRTASNTSLSLDAADQCTASPEEHAAEVDENDMRNQLGLRRRDANVHCGDICGNPVPSGCCMVVASIATGSHSAEVNALRGFRESFLRRSEVGHSFFESLHYEYYGFSPQVCTAMGDNETLVDWIRAYCVGPLIESLRLIRRLLVTGTRAEDVGKRLERALAGGLGEVEPEQLDVALRTVREGRVDSAVLPVPIPAIEHVEAGPHLRWGILDPVEIYLHAARERALGAAAPELGRRFAERVEEWAPRLPLDPFWQALSEFEVRRELAFLESCLLRTPEARAAFARRLLAAPGIESGTMERLLVSSNYPIPEAIS